MGQIKSIMIALYRAVRLERAVCQGEYFGLAIYGKVLITKREGVL